MLIQHGQLKYADSITANSRVSETYKWSITWEDYETAQLFLTSNNYKVYITNISNTDPTKETISFYNHHTTTTSNVTAKILGIGY